MSFQFQCPQCANVLQGEESQAGQQCQCPICATMFIIPSPAPTASSPASVPTPPAPGGFTGINTGAPGATGVNIASTQEPELLHIPCPECKQILETPVEMLDQDVMCPHCQAQFRLRRRDSVEFQRKKNQQQELKDRKAGNAWFNWAIVAVVLVLMFLAFLIFSSGQG